MENQQNYIYGRNAVLEAINSGKAIEKIFIAFGTKGDSLNRIFSLSKNLKIAVTTMDRRKFNYLEKDNGIDSGKSQGIIALVRSFDIFDLDDLVEAAFNKDPQPVIAILDEIEDPHNLGAIARTVECSGATGIIITAKNSSPITPTAVKISAGALGMIPVAKVSSLVQALERLKEFGFWIVGTDMEAENNYCDKIYDRPVALVIGSEGKGLRPSTRKHCDYVIGIPLKGKIASLNASVSAAIVLYEILRQRTSED
jgi:23S rRNA (guanosine2251-2'-O)-methyltransferase